MRTVYSELMVEKDMLKGKVEGLSTRGNLSGLVTSAGVNIVPVVADFAQQVHKPVESRAANGMIK